MRWGKEPAGPQAEGSAQGWGGQAPLWPRPASPALSTRAGLSDTGTGWRFHGPPLLSHQSGFLSDPKPATPALSGLGAGWLLGKSEDVPGVRLSAGQEHPKGP